jgi:alkanesulfonate monooxygenase SsuD/methylene tetrahydromethanopterin reductase-like flavin-dependent oxidoreductase (luciferase family)
MSPARLEVGVLLPTREAVMAGRPEAGPLVDMAERAEAAGFDSVWVGDSLLARPRHEPLMLLAAAAARTRHVALGTAVLLPALRHPLLLAHSVATLDRIAEGRLILGVGLGPATAAVRREYEAAGAPYGERVGRLVESLTLCRELWAAAAAGSAITHRGRYWSVDTVSILPAPHRPGGPPIWMGGDAEGALRRAGRLADGWFPTSRTPHAFSEGWARVRAEAREARGSAAGLTPALYTTINLGADAGAAHAELRQFIEGYYAAPYEAIAAQMGLYAGSLEGCVEWLAGFVAAGVRHIVLRFGGADQAGHVERVGADLLPRLRAAATP